MIRLTSELMCDIIFKGALREHALNVFAKYDHGLIFVQNLAKFAY